MNNNPKIRTRVFTLPGEEQLLDNVQNNDLHVVTNKIVTPVPKEGIIMVYLEYEDYSREEA